MEKKQTDAKNRRKNQNKERAKKQNTKTLHISAEALATVRDMTFGAVLGKIFRREISWPPDRPDGKKHMTIYLWDVEAAYIIRALECYLDQLEMSDFRISRVNELRDYIRTELSK